MSQLLLAQGAGKTEVGGLPASDFCQRWNTRQHSWRHTSEGGFASRSFEVAQVTQAEAISFCETHHYGGKPGGILDQYGLFRSSGQLVGVAVLTNGGFKAVLQAAFPHLAPYDEARELGRLVLLDEVPANAESWFLAEAFRQQAAQGVRGIVSFSDPVARFAPDGTMTMPGHVGTIYQASNATYTGRITPRTVWFHDGRMINEQLLGKVRTPGKEGHDYAVQTFVSWGARAPRRGQDMKVWLAQAKQQTGCYSQRHHGNHRYQFALHPYRPGLSRRQERLARRADPPIALGGTPMAYPKKDQS